MNIIIVGCGKVGYSLAKYLSEEDNDIVIIDKKPEVLEKVEDNLDVLFVKGNCLSTKVLEEAEIRAAELIICVTSSDEVNILCCITAKRLGVHQAIARIRDPEYALELYKFKDDFGVDLIINPEQQAALEISRRLRFPSAVEVDTFVEGRVEVTSYRVSGLEFFVGKPLSTAFSKTGLSILIVAIERGGKVIIPSGSDVLQEGDIIRVLGKPTDISFFYKAVDLNNIKVKDVMIVGGGKITYYLARYLLKHNIKPKIIEIDQEACEELSETLDNVLVINGDGTDEEVLKSENIEETDAVVCLTDRDEENVIIGLYAKQQGVAKTLVKINHINLNIVRNLNIGGIICPKNITTYQIIHYVRGLRDSGISSSIKAMYKMVDLQEEFAEALEFDVKPNSRCIGVDLKDLKIKKGNLVGCIVHKGFIVIPKGESRIRAGDSVIIISKQENIFELDDILQNEFSIFGGNE